MKAVHSAHAEEAVKAGASEAEVAAALATAIALNAGAAYTILYVH